MKMTVTEFLTKYLQTDAIITLVDEKGNVLHEGTCGDAPFYAWNNRELISVEGLGSLNDLIITVGERKKGQGKVK